MKRAKKYNKFAGLPYEGPADLHKKRAMEHRQNALAGMSILGQMSKSKSDVIAEAFAQTFKGGKDNGNPGENSDESSNGSGV